MSYPSHPSSDFSQNIQNENQVLESLLNYLNLEKGSKILDVPCGEGKRTQFLNELGYEVVGIDADMNKIRHGVLVYSGLELYQHDMQDIFYVHYFNLVVLSDYISVFNRPKNENGYILKNLFSCLALNGYLAIGLNREPSDFRKLEEFIGEILGIGYEIQSLSLPSFSMDWMIIRKIISNPS